MKIAALETYCLKGIVFNIQKFSLHDGVGIRTLVFFKGCSLRCHWCSNPESQRAVPEVFYNIKRCLACGCCLESCPRHAIEYAKHGKMIIDRSLCNGCGKCAEVCCTRAITLQGRRMTVDDIMQEIRNDATFYRNSGGGVTFSGGEPLLNMPFVLELAKKIKEERIPLAIETCGHVPNENIRLILPLTDEFLFDVKHIDTERHREGTGEGNDLILSNLKFLSEQGADVTIRIPVIPGWNNDENTIAAIAAYVKELHFSKIHLLPYHNYGEVKYEWLGKEYLMQGIEPLKMDSLNGLAEAIERHGLYVVKGG